MKNTQGHVGQLGGAHRKFRIVALGAAAALVVPMLGSAWVAPQASASGGTSTPGSPQVPQPPSVVYAENFQNVTASGTPESLASYVGATGQGYRADASWLPTAKLCNGWILNSADPVSGSGDDTGCSTNGGATGNTTGGNTTGTAWFFLQQMTYQLGLAQVNAAQGLSLTGSTAGVDPNAVASAQRAGITSADSNNAVSSQTNPAASGSMAQAAGVQVETTGTPVTAIPGHYYAVSAWFAEAHCSGDGTTQQNTAWAGTNALENLSLIINGDTANPLTLETRYNPCTGIKVIGTYNTPIRVSFVQSSAVLLTSAESLGLQLYNENPGTVGNDVTFDLPEIVDVTPQMDKTFGTVDDPITSVAAGVPIPMTITITNTTEMAAKDGWSFTDNMGPHISVAPGTTPTTDCNDAAATPPNGTVEVVTNPDETQSLKVTGNLAQGMAYCTISAMVVPDKAGDFTDGLENISDYFGLDLPGPAEAKVGVTPPTLSLNKTITTVDHPAGVPDTGVTVSSDSKMASGLKAGDVVTYSYQVKNTSAVRLDDVWVIEADPAGGTPTEYPFNGTLADGTIPVEAHPGYATAAELGANFNGSDVTPAVGNCTYDQDGAYGSQGDSVANGSIELDPTESATCTGTYLVTQADVNAYSQGTSGPAPYGVINTSVAIGTNYYTEEDTPSQQSASDTSTAIIIFDTTHGLSLTKSATSHGATVTALKAGDEVDYSFLVTNTGSLTVTNVSIEDSGAYTNDQTVGFSGSGTLGDIGDCQLTLFGASSSSAVAYPIPVMQPGDSATCTATYTMTQTDVDAGSLNNVADATGTTPDNQPEISDVSPLQLPASGEASIVVTKTASVNGSSPSAGVTVTAAGQIVTFTVAAQNTGDVTLHGVSVTDAGLTNPSNVNVSGPLTLSNCTLNDAASTAVTPGDNSITLNANGTPGDTVTCTASYTVTLADIDGGVVLTNTATASGKDPKNVTVNPDQDATATVTPNGAAAVSLTKQIVAPSGPVAAGDSVTFRFTVTNSGDASLQGDTLSFYDSLPAMSSVTCPASGQSWPNTGNHIINPTQSVICSATYVLTQTDIDNGFLENQQATVTATPVSSTTPVTSDPASDTIPLTSTPGLTLDKTSSSTPTNAGDTITYSLVVANSGDTTISDLSLADTTFSGTGTAPVITCPTNSTDWASGTVGVLRPSDTITCAATYTVTQADVDAGIVSNTAQASGTDVSGPVDSNTSTKDVTITADPSLTMSKTATPTSVDAAGTSITYTFVVRNTGNVSLSSLAIDETAFNGSDGVSAISTPTCTPVAYGGKLAPNITTTCTATYNVTQTDIDNGVNIDNTATASGLAPGATDPTTSPESSATVGVVQTPGLSLNKTVSPSDKAYFNVGQEITYRYFVTNTGNVTITDLMIDDSGTTPTATTTGFTGVGPLSAITCPLTTLVPEGNPSRPAAGSSTTCTATYTIAQGDVDDGVLDNTAVASGKDPTDADVTSNPSSAEMPGEPNPLVALVKSHLAPPDPAAAGDTITFTFTVANRGNVTLDGQTLSIADTMTGLSSITCPAAGSDWPEPDETLTPGDTVTCSATYTLTQADIDAGQVVNPQAVATITPVHSTTPIDSGPAHDIVTLTSTSGLTLDKTSSSAPTKAGDAISYSLVVTNSGATTVSALSLADTAFSGTGTPPVITCPTNATDWTSGTVGVLGPSDTITCTSAYTVTQADVDSGIVSNTAQATGTDVGGTVPSNTSTKDVTITPDPSLTVDKTATPASVNVAGATVTYAFVVRNTGNVSLSSLAIDETAFNGAGGMSAISTPTCAPVALGGKLAPQATTTCTATYDVTQADIDNGGSIDNTATASGLAPGATDPTTSPESSATVDVAQSPQLSVVKSVSPSGTLVVNTQLTYSFLVTNTGNVTVTNLAIDDGGAYVDTTTPGFSGTGTLSAITCPVTTLVPQGNPATPATGSSTTCTATYTVTQDDVNNGTVKNTATATGDDPSGTPVTSDPDTATVPATQTPEVSLTKQIVAPSGPVAAGDSVTFRFTVTNSGNVSLQGDTLSFYDSLPAMSSVTCPASGQSWPNAGNHILNPAQSVICSATYALTQTDIDNGFVENQQATVTATPVSSTTPVTSDPASDTIPLTSTPHLSLVKDSTSTPVNVGDTIAYTFTVTNDGDLTVNGVTIADTTSGTNGSPTATCNPTTLAPTEQTVCTATYTVTQADINAGFVHNTATASGLSEGATPTTVTSNESSKDVDFPSQPALKLTKSATPTTGLSVGGTVTYHFLVENTGNVTVSGIAIGETAFSGTGTITGLSCPVTTLNSGATTTCTASYVVTQADVNAGQIDNTATATGFSPSNSGATPDVASNTSSASVTAAQNPAISVTKTHDALIGTTKVGDTVTYRFTVTNTGDVTLTGVGVTDPGPAGGTGTMSAVTCNATTLVPVGAEIATGGVSSTTCTATYTLAQADFDAGTVANTATATGTPPKGSDVTNTGSDTVGLTASPSISIVKKADVSTVTKANDPINYTFVVTNTGNVTLNSITVNDPILTAAGLTVTCDATSLAPSDSTDCAASGPYRVSQVQIDANVALTNTATVSGTPPHGSPVTNTGSVTVTPAGTAKLMLVKSADQSNELVLGAQVIYAFVVTNIGNMTVDHISIDDSTFDGSPALTVTCPATTLAPGASTRCTASPYTVKQADIDRGHMGNVATASGTDPQANTVTSNDSSWDIPQPAVGQLTVTKHATESSVSTAGTVVHYTLTATNTTNVTLTDVVVSDSGVTNGAAVTTPVSVSGCYLNGNNAAVLDNSAGFQLNPGDVATCVATYSVTQADIDAAGDLVNSASATGVEPDHSTVGSNTPTVDVPVQPTTGLLVVKDPPARTVTAPGPISWTISATNTGSAMLHGVKVADPLMSNGQPVTLTVCAIDGASVDNGVGFDLAPGKTVKCTVTYAVSAADMTDGQQLVNAASASGTALGGTVPVVSNNATATVDVAALSIVKTTTTGRVTAADQAVSYTITATNTGSVGLTSVTVTDAGVFNLGNVNVSGPLTVTCPAAAGWPSGVVGTLAPGDVVDCTASYRATQADVDAGGTLTNHATATGKDPDNDTVSGGQTTVTVPVQPAPGQLTLTKTADQTNHLGVGETVNYSFVVTNSGGLTIKNLSIDDSTFTGSPGLTISCPVTTLAPGQSTTCTAAPYTVTQDDVNSGKLDNSANATGTDSHNSFVKSNDSAWNIPQAPDDKLVVTKQASRTSVDAAGDQVNYTITAINQGNVSLTGVTLTDAGVTDGAGITTPVTVGGCYLNGNQSATLDNTAGFVLHPGDVATCTASYTATQVDIDAGDSLTNLASASGQDPAHTTVDSNEPSVSVDVTSSDSLLLTKTPASRTVTSAGDVTWTVTATNDGTSALTGVKIVDPSMSNGSAVTLSGCVVGTSPVDNDLGFTLPTGASATCTATYTVTAGDMAAATQLSNTANASGVDPKGRTVDALPATAKVDFAGLQATKTPATTTVSAAGDVSWTVTATNTGSVALNDVTVDDPQMSNGEAVALTGCRIGTTSVNHTGFTLAPQAVVTCQATYTVTQADLDAGTLLTNTANATGVTPNGVTIPSNDATATVAITQNPALTLLKTADDANTLTVGDQVHYSFLVTNTGNVTVSHISIDDSAFSGSPAIGNITCPATTLAPGESTTCTADPYTVTQDDVNSGDLSNTATVDGTAPDGTDVTSNTDGWDIPQAPSASVSITETPSQPSGLMLGNQLTFFGTATNTGNVPLTNVTLANLTAGWTGSGPMPDIDLTSLKVNGVAVTNGAFTLNPGQQVTYTTLPYTVLQQDVDNNTPLANQASVIGTPPVASRLAPVSADTTVPATMVAAAAHIGIVETPSQASGLKAGDTVTFNIVATNDGNVTLHDVYLSNDPAGWTGAGPMPTLTTFMVNGVSVTNGSFSLAPGESVTVVTTPYTVSTADVGAAKPISNRVVVTGTPPTGLQLAVVTASSVAPVTTIPTSAAPSGPTVQTGGTTPQGAPTWLLLALLTAVIGAAMLPIPLLRRGGRPEGPDGVVPKG